MASQMTCNGTLPGARRSVNGDDKLGGTTGGAQAVLICTHPRFFVSRLGRAEKPNRVLFPTFVPAVNAGLRLVREGRASGRASFLEAALLRLVLDPRKRLLLRAEEPGLPAVLEPVA
jgi:hypothetical protein